MKRVVLFLVTNIAVLLVISIIIQITGANQFLTENGLDLPTLLVFSAIIGFSGSIISLLFSKPIAKMSVGAKVIKTPANSEEAWLVETVGKLAARANLPMPEVAIYKGAPNAFATGPSKSNSLVAVATGLLETMDKDQVEAVLGHEMTHVANGDMVTLTLIQGVVNTFVIFLSRVAAYVVSSLMKDRNSKSMNGGVFYITSVICQIVFGIFATMIVCYYSRKREFAADAGSAKLLNNPNQMISALQALGRKEAGSLPKSMAAFGISGGKSFATLFMTHPPLEVRIEALKNLNQF